MLAVVTEDFELYHTLVSELRGRNVPVTTLEPGDSLPAETTTVLTGRSDTVQVPDDVDVIEVDPASPRQAIDSALADERQGSDRRIIGVDPGTQPGIAVLEGGDVVAAFQVPLDQAADRIREELADGGDPIVRIGDGARLRGTRLIDALDDVRIELVDETGTTPHLGTGTRGMGDILAAVNIAHRTGEPITDRDIDPTAGELAAIQSEARSRSTENRAIPTSLARAVALGELTLEEAVAEHEDN